MEFDPRKLDVAAFAVARGRCAGELPLSELPRLAQDAVPPVAGEDTAVVRWSAQGEWRAVGGDRHETRLRLQAQATLFLTCQRCLQPLPVALAVDRPVLFVQGEALAEKLDEHSEDDVVALGAALDVVALVEDELILALPLVPRHGDCVPPQPAQDAAAERPTGEANRPFAALAALRRARDVAD